MAELPPLLGHRAAVRALAHKPARALDRMGVMAVQAGRPPYREPRRKFAQIGRGRAVGLVGDGAAGMGRADPAVLFVTGQADLVAA